MEREDFMRLTNDEKLEKAEFFVEADSFARDTLWEKHHEKESWIQDNSGFQRHIGNITSKRKRCPVSIMFSFAIINGHYVCFYSPDGWWVDWRMVEEYIKKFAPQYDKGTRISMTTAGNFHNCLHWCRKPH